MASDSESNLDEGRLDLVPMIDCIMLLLLFFILTTHFTSPDQRLAAILPTDQGCGGGRVVMPPPTVRIAVLPDEAGGCLVRIGGSEPLQLSQEDLRQPPGPALEAVVDAFHRVIAERLAVYEQPGLRSAQVPVEIHCATRLPWCAALAVYDAVRGYEEQFQPKKRTRDIPIEELRPIAFAAPTVRGTRTDNERDERERLLHLR